jgi:hypothetical protein
MAGFSEDNIQPFGFHKVFKFFDYLSECQLFKQDSAL